MVEFIDIFGRILLLIVLLKILYFVVSQIYINFGGRLFLKSRLKSYGKWAGKLSAGRNVAEIYLADVFKFGKSRYQDKGCTWIRLNHEN